MQTVEWNMSQDLKRGSEKDKIYQKQRKQHRQHEEIWQLVSYNEHFNNSIAVRVQIRPEVWGKSAWMAPSEPGKRLRSWLRSSGCRSGTLVFHLVKQKQHFQFRGQNVGEFKKKIHMRPGPQNKNRVWFKLECIACIISSGFKGFSSISKTNDTIST